MADAPSEFGRWRGVLLVGFMASGKSSVGRELARRTGWRLVDVDTEIEARAGMSIARIFQDRGEAWFRDMEARVTGEALDLPDAVVVPGGGWAAREGRLDELPPHLLSVWLRVTPEMAVARASKDPVERPLLEGAADPVAAAAELLARREPRYARAILHLDTGIRSTVEVADEIMDRLGRPPATADAKESE